MSKYGVISVPYFPVFGLNTKIYFVNFRIQSEYRKIRRTRNNSVFGHFLRIVSTGHSHQLKQCAQYTGHKISINCTISEDFKCLEANPSMKIELVSITQY